MFIFHRMRLVITVLYILMISAFAAGVVTAQPSSISSIILNEEIDGRLMVDFIGVDTSTAVLTPDEAWRDCRAVHTKGSISGDYHKITTGWDLPPFMNPTPISGFWKL